MHSLPPSLLGYGRPLPAVSPPWAGMQGFSCLLSPVPSSSPPAQGDPPQEARAQLPRERTGRRQASQRRADGKGTTWLLLHHRLAAAPGSHPSEGNGSPARLRSGAATLLRSPLTPHLILRQTEQKFLLLLWGGCLIDYRSQSGDAETPPLPSTRTRFRGPCKEPSIPLRKPRTPSPT